MGDCILWEGAKTSDGYGNVNLNGKWIGAHRLAFISAFGPIEDGLELDHLCRNRACVNPAHLEPVTHRMNILRGQSPSAFNAVKTHCPSGHPYSGTNVRRYPDGRRYCRICNNSHSREYYKKERLR